MHLVYIPGPNEGPEPKILGQEFLGLRVQCNEPWEVKDEETARQMLARVANIWQWDPATKKAINRPRLPLKFGAKLNLPLGVTGIVIADGPVVKVQVEGEDGPRAYPEDRVDTITLVAIGLPLVDVSAEPKRSKKKED